MRTKALDGRRSFAAVFGLKGLSFVDRCSVLLILASCNSNFFRSQNDKMMPSLDS